VIRNITHTRGWPYHPQTQGKIERWHRPMKNQILINHFSFSSKLKYKLGEFVNYYNHQIHHEPLENRTPADVCCIHRELILEK
jgi:putative transposase